MSKARLLITAVILEGRTQTEVAKSYGVSKGWVSKLRNQLATAGLDAGPDTIAWHLEHHHDTPVSRSTISRHLARAGLVTPEPKARTLTPGEYERLLAALPAQQRLIVETLIEAGLRWGELIALKPRHIDLLRRTLLVEETIVEVSKKHSPTGQRYLLKPHPKDNEPRTFGVRQAWLDAVAEHIRANGIGHDELLFPTKAGTPISRNTFRTRIWLPAIKTSGIDFPVRVHDLRHAHASWLLAGGADLMSVMERMGHSQIQTTQKYLHTLPDTDQRNLDALARVQTRRDP